MKSNFNYLLVQWLHYSDVKRLATLIINKKYSPTVIDLLFNNLTCKKTKHRSQIKFKVTCFMYIWPKVSNNNVQCVLQKNCLDQIICWAVIRLECLKTFKWKICTLQQMIKEYFNIQVYKITKKTWNVTVQILHVPWFLNPSSLQPHQSWHLSWPEQSWPFQEHADIPNVQVTLITCMLGYLPTDIICSEKQIGFWEWLKENCEL